MNFENLIPSFLRNSTIYQVIVTNLNGQYIYCNDLFNQKYEFITTSFIGVDTYVTVHPDDNKICNSTAAECLQPPYKNTHGTIRKPTADGDYIWTEWEFSAFFDETGALQGVLCVGHDFSYEKKLLQDLDEKNKILDTIFNNSHASKILIDLNGSIKIFNERFSSDMEQMMGRIPKSGDIFLQFIPQDFREDATDLLTKASNGTIGTSGIHYLSEGKNRIYLFTVCPVADEQSQTKTEWIFISALDITLQIETETTVKKQKNLLREIAFQESHLVRAPVANILAIGQVLSQCVEEKDLDEAKKCIHYLNDSTNQLDDIIKEIVKRTNIII